MDKLKLQLLFGDRLGIVLDLATIIAEKGLNIISMEVINHGDFTDVFLEMVHNDTDIDETELFKSLKLIPDLLKIKKILTLPQEKREEGYKVVLDSVSDGIISVDEKGRLTTINKVARKFLNCQDTDVVGKDITTLPLKDNDLLVCLTDKSLRRVKKNVITDKGRFRFFSSCKPIKDSSDRVVGAVEIMKDVKEIKALAHAVSEPAQITFTDIIGKSPAINAAISLAQKIADTDAIVSIRGESGTGKELFARSIHAESDRTGPFVPINCAALPESLLESELFGYEGGAFTGAKKQGKPGLFETATGGTVFLDEIAETPLRMQAKILRVIQERRVRRISGTTEKEVDTRIITATNKNLEKMVEERLFREDLYYRINVLPIHIPPLRRRIDDLVILTEHFLFGLSSKLNKTFQQVTPEAMQKLASHDWPGNVRELKNVIERAAILTDNDRLTGNSILFSFEIGKTIRGKDGLSHLDDNPSSLRDRLAVYEKKLIEEALSKSLSIRKTATLLKISHTALLNKIRRHNLNLESN
ncbi:MAG: sigma 54-interacting transcriptional regulator [Desulfobacteraceae bacterium]|nr:sigma 54-interacting transcriptional regulator [Desulfobacteraceae bacterium]